LARLEWPTLTLIAFCYGCWWLAGAWIYPAEPVAALAMMAVLTALHSSLTHECVHGHPTRSRLVNEVLMGLPLGIVYPYRRFKATHLAHHHDEWLTDPFEDPESYYNARWQYERMPRWLRAVLHVNNTLIGRMVLGPVLGAVGFFLSDAQALFEGKRGVRLAWALHLAGLVPLIAILNWFGIPLWLYLVAVVWPGLSLIAIRTFAEHRWHDAPEGRTIIVERSPLGWLFLHNNLHIVHHTMPGVPWYRLPGIYAENPALWRAKNQHYVFPNYTRLFREYALRAKEPIVHPAWRHSEGAEPLARPGSANGAAPTEYGA